VVVFMSVGGQGMTARVNHKYGKIALRIILHSAKPVVGFLNERWLQA